MADGTNQGALALDESAATGWGAALVNAARACGPPLLFGLRLWAAVCLALYIAFWLELDNASWAGTTAAIVCQPNLGASLRKGWFRMVGTPTGGFAIVVHEICRHIEERDLTPLMSYGPGGNEPHIWSEGMKFVEFDLFGVYVAPI
jgi:hypothetical protein